MLRQQLEQRLQQKLSPAQLQVIKMIEIPTLELEERIQHELEENPALEEGADDIDNQTEDFEGEDSGDNNENDFDLDDYMSDDEVPDYKLSVNNNSPDDKHEDIPFSAGFTFHEYLIDQIGLLSLDEHQRKLVEYIIGSHPPESMDLTANTLSLKSSILVSEFPRRTVHTSSHHSSPPSRSVMVPDLVSRFLMVAG